MTLSVAELKREILAELSAHSVLALAAQGDEGPHVVSLLYANAGLDIFWLSDPDTRHSRYLENSPLAAVTIAAQQEDFRKIRGLQMQGRAQRISDSAQAAAGMDLLAARYKFLKQFGVGKLARHLGAASVYRFRPAQLTLIDNSRGFGFKQTLVPQETRNDRH